MERFTQEVSITIPSEKIHLQGILNLPENATKLIVFAHGSGSGLHSPRNQYVANVLNDNHMGTLLLDLLTPEEEAIDDETRQYRFNIPLLAERLIGTTDWLKINPTTQKIKIGYFGASTGSAAALIAASRSKEIFAVVSRGGRPDLAAKALPNVTAPTLLIVGENDFDVMELNQEAFNLLQCEKKLDIVPGATHLFEEKGALETVAKIATVWFQKS